MPESEKKFDRFEKSKYEIQEALSGYNKWQIGEFLSGKMSKVSRDVEDIVRNILDDNFINTDNIHETRHIVREFLDLEENEDTKRYSKKF